MIWCLFYIIGVEYTCCFTHFHYCLGWQLCKCFMLAVSPFHLSRAHSQNSSFACGVVVISSVIVTWVFIAHVGRVSRLKIGLIDKVIFASQLPGVVYKLCQVEAPSNTHLLRGGHVPNIGVANPNRGYIEWCIIIYSSYGQSVDSWFDVASANLSWWDCTFGGCHLWGDQPGNVTLLVQMVVLHFC